MYTSSQEWTEHVPVTWLDQAASDSSDEAMRANCHIFLWTLLSSIKPSISAGVKQSILHYKSKNHP